MSTAGVKLLVKAARDTELPDNQNKHTRIYLPEFIILGFLTMMRPSEMLGLELDRVDFKNKGLELDRTIRLLPCILVTSLRPTAYPNYRQRPLLPVPDKRTSDDG